MRVEFDGAVIVTWPAGTRPIHAWHIGILDAATGEPVTGVISAVIHADCRASDPVWMEATALVDEFGAALSAGRNAVFDETDPSGLCVKTGTFRWVVSEVRVEQPPLVDRQNLVLYRDLDDQGHRLGGNE